MQAVNNGYTERQILTILSNYHWMIKEASRISYLLCGTDQKLTSTYGIESAMPKPQGGLPKDVMANEVIRKDKKKDRRVRLLNKVNFIQDRIHLITEEREKVILDCLLDGMSISAISNHMGLSRKHVERLRHSIAGQMSHMSHLSQN